MSMKANGYKTRLKEKEYTSIKMVLLILVSGTMISSMVMGTSNGQMEQSTMEIISRE